MDPMDYTMDSGEANRPQTGHRFPCHAPPVPPTANNLIPGGRDYDPVRDQSGWYQPNHTNVQSRNPYPPPQNGHNPYLPGPPPYLPGPAWHGFPEGHPAAHSLNGSSYRPQNHFTSAGNPPQWPDLRGYEGLSFDYGSYTSGNNTAAEVSVGRNHNATSAATTPHLPTGPASQRREWYGSMEDSDPLPLHRPSTFGGPSFPFSENIPRSRESVSTETGNNAPSTPATSLNQLRLERFNLVYRSYAPPAPYTRRGMAPNIGNGHRPVMGYHSEDDDDDPVPEIEEAYVRNSELLFSPDAEEYRVAVMRGATAVGKKIPSKEAIKSLIPMAVKDVLAEGEDISCMICYNDYGVKNPEGIFEIPLRLPKCKHIFGNVCIKKWFEDSDTCPYCRDKLPSEISHRKSATLEALRANRANFISAYRARVGVPLYPFPDDPRPERSAGSSVYTVPSGREGHEPMQNRDEWGFSSSPPAHSHSSNSLERRRQSRGRVGNTRPTQAPGRPTQVGSSPFTPRTNQQTTAAQRALVLGLASGYHPMGGNAQRRSITPAVPRGIPPSLHTTPPRNSQLPAGPSPSEEASPAVAVGSFSPSRAPTRERVADILRREMENPGSWRPDLDSGGQRNAASWSTTLPHDL